MAAMRLLQVFLGLLSWELAGAFVPNSLPALSSSRRAACLPTISRSEAACLHSPSCLLCLGQSKLFLLDAMEKNRESHMWKPLAQSNMQVSPDPPGEVCARAGRS